MSCHERSNDLPTWQQVPAHTVLRSAPPGPLFTCFHPALCLRRANCRDCIHGLSCLSFVLHLSWEMRSRILEGEKGGHDKYSLGPPCVVALGQLSLTLPVIRSPPQSLLPGLVTTAPFFSIKPKVLMQACCHQPLPCGFPACYLHHCKQFRYYK